MFKLPGKIWPFAERGCNQEGWSILLSVASGMASSKLQGFWNHPAGPKTIFFWAPTFKWGISIANAADFSKPPETLSYPQQLAVAITGIIWSRYSTIITPKNLNLFGNSLAMSATGIYQLSRKIRHDYFSENDEAERTQQMS